MPYNTIRILSGETMASRFEVRLDVGCRQRLDELAEKEGIPASEVVRRLIDDAYKNVIKSQRARAVEELAEMSADVPDDPEELYRVLEDTHEAHGIP